jgi:dipeptide/tripeptide permease
MSRHSACNLPTCATVVEGRVSICPKCGGPMRDVSDSAVRGIVMLVCGVLLVGMMGWILWTQTDSMLNPGVEAADGSTFTGTAKEAQSFLALFAVVMLLGLTSFINGIFFIVKRRQSGVFIAISLGLAAILMALTYFILRSAP